MSLCSWLLVDIAFLFDFFFFFFSPVTLLECCCRSWLSEQGWLNQWKDCGETCEVCRKHKHLRSFSVLKGWHAEIQNLFTSQRPENVLRCGQKNFLRCGQIVFCCCFWYKADNRCTICLACASVRIFIFFCCLCNMKSSQPGGMPTSTF